MKVDTRGWTGSFVCRHCGRYEMDRKGTGYLAWACVVRGYCENRNELIQVMYVAQSRQQASMVGYC